MRVWQTPTTRQFYACCQLINYIKMEYNFKPRPTGKSFSAMIQLKANLLNGLKCSVATLNPEKTKRDFEYMTGSKLILQVRKDITDMYDAYLA